MINELLEALFQHDDDKYCHFCAKTEWGAEKHEEGCPFEIAYRISISDKEDKILEEILELNPNMDLLREAAYAAVSKVPMYVIPNSYQPKTNSMSGKPEFYITTHDGESHTYGSLEAAAERVAELYWEESHSPETAPVCLLVPVPVHLWYPQYEQAVHELKEDYDD